MVDEKQDIVGGALRTCTRRRSSAAMRSMWASGMFK
jgi:hypothetical protein